MGMFHIINSYYMTIEPSGCTLLIRTEGKKGKLVGKPLYRPGGYHSSVEEVMKSVLKHLIADKSKSKQVHTLEDLVQIIKDSKTEIHVTCQKLGV